MRRQRIENALIIDKHQEDIASVLKKLITNLKVVSRYRQHKEIKEWKIDDVVLSESEQGRLQPIDELLTKCLLSHIQVEIPDLKHINKWGQMRIKDVTDELLNKLYLIAYQRTSMALVIYVVIGIKLD